MLNLIYSVIWPLFISELSLYKAAYTKTTIEGEIWENAFLEWNMTASKRKLYFCKRIVVDQYISTFVWYVYGKETYSLAKWADWKVSPPVLSRWSDARIQRRQELMLSGWTKQICIYPIQAYHVLQHEVEMANDSYNWIIKNITTISVDQNRWFLQQNGRYQVPQKVTMCENNHSR